MGVARDSVARREIQVRKPVESGSRAVMTAATSVTRAWSEGYAAGRRGLTAASNPHPMGSVAATDWLNGLAAGRVRHLRVISGGRCD
jgi:hypothetical protein